MHRRFKRFESAGRVRRSRATLSFAGPDVVPEQLSAILGIAATGGYRKGETPPYLDEPAVVGQWTYQLEARTGEGLGGPSNSLAGGVARSGIHRLAEGVAAGGGRAVALCAAAGKKCAV